MHQQPSSSVASSPQGQGKEAKAGRKELEAEAEAKDLVARGRARLPAGDGAQEALAVGGPEDETLQGWDKDVAERKKAGGQLPKSLSHSGRGSPGL